MPALIVVDKDRRPLCAAAAREMIDVERIFIDSIFAEASATDESLITNNEVVY